MTALLQRVFLFLFDNANAALERAGKECHKLALNEFHLIVIHNTKGAICWFLNRIVTRKNTLATDNACILRAVCRTTVSSIQFVHSYLQYLLVTGCDLFSFARFATKPEVIALFTNCLRDASTWHLFSVCCLPTRFRNRSSNGASKLLCGCQFFFFGQDKNPHDYNVVLVKFKSLVWHCSQLPRSRKCFTVCAVMKSCVSVAYVDDVKKQGKQ